MKRKHSENRLGFTLVELLGVIMIIGILAGIILGVSGVASKNAAISSASADLEHWKTALDEYRLSQGTLLGLEGASQSFTNLITDITNTVTDITVTDLKTVDPWGSEYEYERTGKYTYAIRSAGPDGSFATEEDNISNENEN